MKKNNQNTSPPCVRWGDSSASGKKIFDLLVKKYGSQAAAARAINIPYAKFNASWSRRGIPVHYALYAMSFLDDVKPWDFYPDIYNKKLLERYFK